MESCTFWILMSFFHDWISAPWWRIPIPDPRNVVVEFFMLYFHTIQQSQFCKTLPFNLPKADCLTFTHISSVSPFCTVPPKYSFSFDMSARFVGWRHIQPDLASHCLNGQKTVNMEILKSFAWRNYSPAVSGQICCLFIAWGGGWWVKVLFMWTNYSFREDRLHYGLSSVEKW